MDMDRVSTPTLPHPHPTPTPVARGGTRTDGGMRPNARTQLWFAA